MQDPYVILGVPRTAQPEEIKVAYRRLVMQHHPDRGGDSAKFDAIAKAYAILSSPVQRANYHRNSAVKEKPKPVQAKQPLRTRILNRDRDEVDLWKQTPGTGREAYWKEYERMKVSHAYEEPDKFWADLNNWWEKQK